MKRIFEASNALELVVDLLRKSLAQEKAILQQLVEAEKYEEAKAQIDLISEVRAFSEKVRSLSQEWPGHPTGHSVPTATVETALPKPPVETKPEPQPPKELPSKKEPEPPVPAAPPPAKAETKPVPKPDEKPAAPSVRDIAKFRQTRERLGSDLKAILGRIQKLDGGADSDVDLALRKAELCRLRAIRVEGVSVGLDLKTIDSEIQRLAVVIGQQEGSGRSQLGSNGQGASAKEWGEMADAYHCLAEGERVAEWIRQNPGNPDILKILNTLASCALVVYRYHLDFEFPFDKQQERFRGWVETLVPEGHVVQCWMPPDNGGPKTPAVMKEAQRMATMFKSHVIDHLAKANQEFALAQLVDTLSQPFEGDDFADALSERIAACLAAKIPPSDKRLRTVLLPAIDLLEQGEGQQKRLYDYVHKDASLAATRGQIPTLDVAIHEEETPDDEHAKMLGELRSVLQGKRLLIVGGKKGQAQRANDYQKALGLKEVLWPDMEKDSNIKELWAPLDKADVAVLLVKFCRHHYADVLAEAKKQGKPTARIKGGLGLRRVVLDLYDQLVANRRNGDA